VELLVALWAHATTLQRKPRGVADQIEEPRGALAAMQRRRVLPELLLEQGNPTRLPNLLALATHTASPNCRLQIDLLSTRADA
jgi:hypothetical protein